MTRRRPKSANVALGDVHVFVSDLPVALRFWSDGLGLTIRERETSASVGFAVLEFPDGGGTLRLMGGAEAWKPGQRPSTGARPTIRFDVTTTDLDATLIRLLENGGQQVDEIEAYGGQRVVSVVDPDGNSFELIEVPE